MVGDEEVYYIEDAKKVWAKVKTIRSQKALLAGAYSIPDTLYITIWYRPFDAEEYRIAYNGNIYGIDGAIDVDNAHVDIEITCTKEPNALPMIAKPTE